MTLRLLFVAGVALGTAAGARAGEPRALAGAGPSVALDLVGPAGPSETFAVDPGLAAALLATAVEETVRVADWPLAPGDRWTVEVTRHDVYAPEARIVAIGAGGETELPRSPVLFFWGTAAGDPSRRVLVSLDPDTGTLGGLGVTPDGVFEVRAAPRRGEYRVARPAEAPPVAGGVGGEFACARPLTHAEGDLRPQTPVPRGETTSTLASLHTATIAVDTDNELLSLKFSDSTAGATTYLASLVAGMNVIYERDLFVRLLQGHTILRLSSAADPWTQPGCPAWPASCQSGGASGAQLSELSSYWAANYAAVPRALTMMLSGKQSSVNSASGIAWLGGLCSGSQGYSFSQVFKYSGSTASSDAKLVAHEVGHNFGSDHTHCFPTPTTPVDTCYSGESGCYVGATSCPTPFTIDPVNGSPVTGVTGTLMSYCHMLPGCSASSVFHPQSVAVIAPIVDGKVGVCIFPNAGAPSPAVSSVSPASGSTAGGTALTIVGTGFQSGATVSFVDATRAVGASSVSFVSGTQLTAVTPAHAAGVTDVVVGNPTKRTATRAGAFTFTAPIPGALVGGAKTVSGSFSPGGSITYTITLRNTGGGTQPNAAGSDELTDVLPSSLTLVSAAATAGTATAIPATNAVVWNGSIASGGSVAVAVQASVKATTAAGTVVSNQGTVRYDGDGNGTNESSALTDDPGQAGAANPTAFTVTAPPAALDFYTVAPCRLVDTRAADGPAIAAGASRTFALAGDCALPSGAKAVSLNVTVVAGSAPGSVVVYPGDLAAPAASTTNFVAGQTRANNVIVGLASSGAGTVAVMNRAAAAVHLVVDVNGYFQ
ncbi:MAG TPA: M12 family metallo-peptidase [Vicinamibacteria bacterium]|nr:M12 family metallo-peptidase [Vicinamibacteria bacterium]